MRNYSSRAAIATAHKGSPRPSVICASSSFIYDAKVFPVRYVDGKVDVKVVTRDVWTLDPSISFGRSGGTNSTSYSLQDENFLGWGKDLEIGRQSNVDRTSNSSEYSDPNVLGSRWTATLAYVDSSDGNQRIAQLSQPFYSLDTRVERQHSRADATIARSRAITSATSSINSTTMKQPTN